MRRALILVPVLLSSCGALPRDPDGTFERVGETDRFSVGYSPAASASAPAAAALVRALEVETGARAQPAPAQGEELLRDLEEGKVDLVVGRFSDDSPWKSALTFGPPLERSAGAGKAPILRAALRNGENRWIMAVERAGRTAAPASER